MNLLITYRKLEISESAEDIVNAAFSAARQRRTSLIAHQEDVGPHIFLRRELPISQQNLIDQQSSSRLLPAAGTSATASPGYGASSPRKIAIGSINSLI